MKKVPILVALSLIVVVLQQAVFSNIKILGIAFDIVFVYIVCYSLTRNDIESIIIALFTGVIRDAFFPGVFGVNTIIYIITAYLAGIIQKKIYRNSIFIPIVFTMLFTILKDVLYFSFMYLINYKPIALSIVIKVILVEGISNSVISIIMYKIMQKLNRTKLLKEEWKF